MILILPLLSTFIITLVGYKYSNDEEDTLIQYTLLSIILMNIIYNANILLLVVYILLLYAERGNLFYTLIYAIASIFIFYANTLFAFFISVELISFIVITFINLYIQDKLPGILYYLFSALFSALFILSLGYLYMGYTIAYSLITLVFVWKLGLGPFHILMPYIYNSLSPMKILFIDIISKYLLFYIFSRLLISIPLNIYPIIIISIVLGGFLSLTTNNLLNILIYSSITNYGLLLILYNYPTLFATYLIYYSFMVVIYLYLIIYKDLGSHYYLDNPYYIFLWAILIFNFMGIPPFCGFWIKLYALNILVLNGSYFTLFIILVSLLLLSSVYLRILLEFLCYNLQSKISLLYFNSNSISSHFIASLAILLLFPLL